MNIEIPEPNNLVELKEILEKLLCLRVIVEKLFFLPPNSADFYDKRWGMICQNPNNVISYIGIGLFRTLETEFIDIQKKCPLKVSLDDFAKRFNEIIRSKKHVMTLGELFSYIDLSKLTYLRFLQDPLHTKILISKNPQTRIEDSDLLGESFFLLVKAENELKKHKIVKQKEKNQLIRRYLSLLNSNISLYSKLSCVNFCATVESFVNSIGYDYFMRNKQNIEESDVMFTKLQGYKLSSNGRPIYLSLINKMKYFVKVLTNNNVEINDSIEPFKTFSGHTEIRDSSVHYSPIKEEIFKLPVDWVTKANDVAKSSIEVCKRIWELCYPTKTQPDYMHQFDWNYWYKNAEERLKMEEEMNPLKK
ncbi:MAG: hypothetical protein K8S87_04015 [Planctomycetes bacterium]|nr:hypothetical protein [Planctomycetota bacterium]